MTFSKVLQRGDEVNLHLVPGEGDEKIEGLKSETTSPVLKC